MCLPDSSFPSTRSRVYKSALRTLTQITLPTLTGMKTNRGEGIATRFHVGRRAFLLTQEKQPPLLLPHTSTLHSCQRGGTVTLTDGMCRPTSADLCRGCRVTSSCGACRWPEVTPGHPSSLQDPWERHFVSTETCWEKSSWKEYVYSCMHFFFPPAQFNLLICWYCFGETKGRRFLLSSHRSSRFGTVCQQYRLNVTAYTTWTMHELLPCNVPFRPGANICFEWSQVDHVEDNQLQNNMLS